MLEKVFYTSVLVSDQDRALDFYTNVLLPRIDRERQLLGPGPLSLRADGDDRDRVAARSQPSGAREAALERDRVDPGVAAKSQ